MFSARTNKRFGWLSLLIVAGYFVVGLWPFDFQPPNHVRWLAVRPGLHFQPYGIAYDASPLPKTGGNGKSSADFALELWLEAQHEPANNVFDILTIYNPRLPHDFTLCQWKQDFLLRATTLSAQKSAKTPEVGLDGKLSEGKPQFITVCGNETGTDFYVDGKIAGQFSNFVLSADALDGRLILGNDSSGKHSWTGATLGLAIYGQALDPAEIARHYALWTQGRAAQLTNSTGLRALYLFDEGNGVKTKDSSGNRHDLAVPVEFQPVHRALLIPPWKDMAYHHPDYSDIAVNILGFMPFGFCFFFYCHARRPAQRLLNFALVVLAGVGISLTIEIVQAWLPNRTSSLMDLLTNTVGTFLGVALAMVIKSRRLCSCA